MASSVSFDDDRENSTTPTKKSPAKESDTPQKTKLRSAHYSSGLFQRVLEASKQDRLRKEEAKRAKSKREKGMTDSELQQEADHERPSSQAGPTRSEGSILSSSSNDDSASSATSSSDRSEDSGGSESDDDDFVVAPAKDESDGDEDDEDGSDEDEKIDSCQRELESALPVWGQDEEDFLEDGQKDPDLYENTPGKRKRDTYHVGKRADLKEGTIAHAAYTVLKYHKHGKSQGLKAELLAYLINEGESVKREVTSQHIHTCLKHRPEFTKTNGFFRFTDAEEES